MAQTTKRGAADKSHARMGRPPKHPKASEYWETPLHELLVEKMGDAKPAVIKGDRIDTKTLAESCGVARYTVYRWFRLASISPKAANKLIKISKGNLTKEDMFPFVLG